MRKFNLKKVLSLVLAAFVAFGVFAAGAVNVNAGGKTWQVAVDDPIWIGTECGISVVDTDWEEWADITAVKSSNPKILTVKKGSYTDDSETYTFYDLKGKKAGKVTLTVDFDTPEDGHKVLVKTVKVKKYPKAITNLKVNGKKVSTVKHKFYYNKKISKSKTSVKIKMSLKKGWKIVGVYADRAKVSGEDYKTFTVTKSALKKGKAIKFPKDYKEMYITVTLKKGSDYFNYNFYFYR